MLIYHFAQVENESSRTGAESEAEARSSDDSQDTVSKKKSKSKKKKNSAVEKDPVKELRRRATVKRSNSLDSLTFRAPAQETVVSLFYILFFGISCQVKIYLKIIISCITFFC